MDIIDELHELARPKLKIGAQRPSFIIVGLEAHKEIRSNKRYFKEIERGAFNERISGIPILETGTVVGMKAVITLERVNELDRTKIQR